MTRPLAILMLAAALTSGCGEAETAFNDSFDENFTASCRASATQVGAPADAAAEMCDCGLAKINEKYSASEKLTISEDEVQPIMIECLQEMTQP